jgi:CRISPR associated protein, Cas1 family
MQRSSASADTAALARTWFDSGPAPVTSVSASRRKASATTRSNERTLLPPKAMGRRSSRLNHSVGPPSAAESRRARMIGVGSVTNKRRGRAGELGIRRKRRTVGDIIGAAGETVIGKDHGAMFWCNQRGGDGEVLAPVRLRWFKRQARRHRNCPLSRNRAKASLSAGSRLVAEVAFGLGAIHPMQAMLNYSVGVLAGRMTRVVLASGLDAAFGFLHDGRKPGRLSLVWDAVEPHRPGLVRAVFQYAEGWRDPAGGNP